MARPLRIEYPGAVYHVVSRANRRERIFTTDGQRRAWLACLREVCEQTGWVIHAYVLMGNHYHILLETPEPNLSVGMRWFQGTFTHRYNRYNQQVGHLYQGRYKSLVMDPDSPMGFHRVSSYIHLNPARAGLVAPPKESLRDYPWSSYPFYLLSPRKRPQWLRCARVLECAGELKDTPSGRKGYEAFLEGRFAEVAEGGEGDACKQNWKDIRRGWYLGDRAFKKVLEKKIELKASSGKREGFMGEGIMLHDRLTAQKVCKRALKALGLSARELRKLKKNDERKKVIAWYLRGTTVIDRQRVSEWLWMGHPSTVSRAISAVRDSQSRTVRKMKAGLKAIPR